MKAENIKIKANSKYIPYKLWQNNFEMQDSI